jgi:hypothetical protein
MSEQDEFSKIYKGLSEEDKEWARLIVPRLMEALCNMGGLLLEFFILDNTTPIEGATKIADTVTANPDDEVWVELQHYRDKKQMEENMASMVKDQNIVRLYKGGSNLITPGSRFIIGKFNRITI